MNTDRIERVKFILTRAAARIETENIPENDKFVAYNKCVQAVIRCFSLTLDELREAGLEITVDRKRVI